MARTYPRSIIEDDLKSRAEGRVFELIRDGLDDDWEAYHAVSWIARDHAEGAIDGEIDFVLCHPEKAIVCLEVKGGDFECDGREFFRTVDGLRERMRDPFRQALDHRYALERRLEAARPGLGRGLFLVHGLVLPDISVHSLVLAPDAPHQIVIDRIELRDLPGAIEGLLKYHRGSREKRRPPGAEGAGILRDLLAPRVRIHVPMAQEFLGEEREMVLLTRQQTALLGQFGRDRRMVVTGCAGSGKTMLAVERAKRLASDGRSVGYICFNRALRDHLCEREGASGIDFHTFHGLCTHLARRAKVALPEHAGDPPPEYWRAELPLALMEACEALGAPYDDLVIDEAQDLHTDRLDAVMSALRDPDAGSVWLFLDDNQRVYDVKLDVPPEYRPFDLTINCRNTQAIHREVMKLYQGALRPEVMGPPGREIELVHTTDQPRAVADIIRLLCEEEEVAPQDIVILSSHGFERSRVAASPPEGYAYSPAGAPRSRVVRLSSIRGFKGLEATVVILCELEDLHDQTADQQLYVGLSRARNHCVVVCPPAA